MSKKSLQARILLIEELPRLAARVQARINAEESLECLVCTDPNEALLAVQDWEPTVILHAADHPHSLSLLRSIREHTDAVQIPILMLTKNHDSVFHAQAYDLGANDVTLKYPWDDELLARIRALIHLRQRDEATARLNQELDAGRHYLDSLLPAPMSAPFLLKRTFQPCQKLGGDMIGCTPINGDRTGIYVIDVSGHGLASAFLAVSIRNAVHSKSLKDVVDFGDPSQVLFALDQAFPYEANGEKYFTMWYGVYDHATRMLRWSAGAQPAPLLLEAHAAPYALLEAADAVTLGFGLDKPPGVAERRMEPGDRVFVYSDGVYDVHLPGNKTGSPSQLHEFIQQHAARTDPPILDRLLSKEWAWKHSNELIDDFSIMELEF